MKKILFVATVDIHIINFHLSVIKKLTNLGYIIDVASNGTYTNEDINQKYNVCFSKDPFSLDNITAYFKIKEIAKKNNYDIISCHTPLSSFFTRLACRKLKSTKIFYTAHGFHFFKGCPLINKLVYKNMEKIAARYTDLLITINNEDYLESLNFKLKVNGLCMHIPGVGVDISKIINAKANSQKLRKELNISDDDIVILSVGELNNNKNHIIVLEGLLDKFLCNKNLKYYICGVGGKKDDYIKFINQYKLNDQILLLGYRNDICDIYHLANIFIFPSKREGLPVSLMEALATGIISIATDVRGNRDLITDGVNGFLIKNNSKEDLLEKFNKVTKLSSIEHKKICENAKNSMLIYEKNAIENQILELYTY